MPQAPRNEPAETSPEVHFPEIERLIQTEEFETVNKGFSTIYDSLEKIAKGRGGMGKTRDARKAMKSIERVMDLIRDLLKLKYQLNQTGVAPPQGKK